MNQATLQRPSGRGKFITFEGGEGSGKSTQIKKLAERLAATKLRAIVTREPGGSPGAEIMRHLVLSGMGKLLGPEAETLLFAAARDDHVRTVIQPALGQGTWVLCDRFSDSTRAYQGSLGSACSGPRRAAAAACLTGSSQNTCNSIRICATPTGRSPPKTRSAAC